MNSTEVAWSPQRSDCLVDRRVRSPTRRTHPSSNSRPLPPSNRPPSPPEGRGAVFFDKCLQTTLTPSCPLTRMVSHSLSGCRGVPPPAPGLYTHCTPQPNSRPATTFPTTTSPTMLYTPPPNHTTISAFRLHHVFGVNCCCPPLTSCQ
jgi:hypothetical protein